MTERAPFNPPAFPCEAQGDRTCPPEHDYIQTGIHSSKFPGMTLRDYFAGQAIGEATRYAFDNMEAGTNFGKLPEEWAAQIAYRLADELLARRDDVK